MLSGVTCSRGRSGTRWGALWPAPGSLARRRKSPDDSWFIFGRLGCFWYVLIRGSQFMISSERYSIVLSSSDTCCTVLFYQSLFKFPNVGSKHTIPDHIQVQVKTSLLTTYSDYKTSACACMMTWHGVYIMMIWLFFTSSASFRIMFDILTW